MPLQLPGSSSRASFEAQMAHPPSRLSPPLGTTTQALFAPGRASEEDRPAGQSSTSRKKEEGPKRGYRACLHCRNRKAKCDLGDVNAPSSPPCSRCRREQRQCVFVPSKRRKKNHDEEPFPVAPSLEWKTSPPLSASSALPQVPPQLPGGRGSLSALPSWQVDTSQLPGQTMSLVQFDSKPTDHPSASDSAGSMMSPSSRTRKRRQGSPDATRRIIAANFTNETDALEILATAAAEDDSEGSNKGEGRRIKWNLEEGKAKGLEDYCLVKAGVVTITEAQNLVALFFERHHPVLPVFQTTRIPRTMEQLGQLAQEDAFLLSVLILVASRYHSETRIRTIHDRVWDVVREALADHLLSGLPATVGFVEGVLLLSEFLPRETTSKPLSRELLGVTGKDAAAEGIETRRSWTLTGVAIRAGYGLGLDQVALEAGGERTADLERARSLRTGLAFWSRGPTLCFLGYSHISQTGEAAARENFPYMLSPATPNSGPGDDSASLIQALMELTQIMTNAHDILYPSKGRTSALVSQGTYFKYCDHFRKALDTYALVWTPKMWGNPSLKELANCTYQFVRLYVCSFAFQAHVQRAQMKAEENPGATDSQLFPRASATSPDALYIYESIDAANEILHICLRLGQMAVLQDLPSRYLINFVYGGVFALKAGYSGATSKRDMQLTKELVNAVANSLVRSCPDREHPAPKYGKMLRLLAVKLEEMSDASAVPSRFPSPEPTTSSIFGSGLQMTGLENMQVPVADMAVRGDGDGLLDLDIGGVNFNLDGFWDDFTLLGDGSGFPFK